MCLLRQFNFGRCCSGTLASWTGGAVAGTAPSLAAGWTASLSAQVGKMEMVVADQARALQPETPIARRRLHHASRWMPIDSHDALALASFDQHLVTMHRGEEDQPLHPINGHSQSVVVTQIIELGGIFALDGDHPHRL